MRDARIARRVAAGRWLCLAAAGWQRAWDARAHVGQAVREASASHAAAWRCQWAPLAVSGGGLGWLDRLDALAQSRRNGAHGPPYVKLEELLEEAA